MDLQEEDGGRQPVTDDVTLLSDRLPSTPPSHSNVSDSRRDEIVVAPSAQHSLELSSDGTSSSSVADSTIPATKMSSGIPSSEEQALTIENLLAAKDQLEREFAAAKNALSMESATKEHQIDFSMRDTPGNAQGVEDDNDDDDDDDASSS